MKSEFICFESGGGEYIIRIAEIRIVQPGHKGEGTRISFIKDSSFIEFPDVTVKGIRSLLDGAAY
jgi:hypothetical protein